jgi:GntR family transcriptional regulator
MHLPIVLQKESGIPIYIQVREQIHLLIHQGILKPGDPIPTVRALSVSLGINSNTVARIYRDLENENLLILKRGLGTFVAQGVPTQATGSRHLERLETKAHELIALAQESGIGAIELYQFIESQWKEVEARSKSKRSPS